MSIFNTESLLVVLVLFFCSSSQEEGTFLGDSNSKHFETYDLELLSCDENALSEKRHSNDLSLSVAAAWETVLRQQESSGTKLTTDWFIGFLESKLVVDAPKGWKSRFQRTVVSEFRSTWINIRDFDQELKKTKFGIECPEDVIVEREKDVFVLKRGDLKILVSEDILSSAKNTTLTEISSASGITVVGLFDQRNRNEFKVCAAQNDQLLWVSKGISGGNFGVISTGLPRIGYSELLIDGNKNRVFVFGISSDSMHINAFDLTSGEAVFRFSTSWFCKRPNEAEESSGSRSDK